MSGCIHKLRQGVAASQTWEEPEKPRSAFNNQAAPCRLRMGERVASILCFSRAQQGPRAARVPCHASADA